MVHFGTVGIYTVAMVAYIYLQNVLLTFYSVYKTSKAQSIYL